MSTATAPTRAELEDTCPDFCEQTEHENIDTAESPVYVHRTGSHVVHGVRMYVSTVTDAEGCEVEDDALSVSIDGEQLSLREAREVAMAILEAVNRAELSDPEVQRLFRDVGPVESARAARALTSANHEKHASLRTARKDPKYVA